MDSYCALIRAKCYLYVHLMEVRLVHLSEEPSRRTHAQGLTYRMCSFKVSLVLLVCLLSLG